MSDPSIRADVSKSTATLGDVLSLGIQVQNPVGVIVDPPTLGATLGAFEVRASTQLPVQFSGDVETHQFQTELQAFTTGQQLIPALDFPFHDLQGRSGVLHSPSLTVTVNALPPGPKDKGDIRGIKGVIGPVAFSPWWWLLVAAVVAAVGVWAWRRRKLAIEGPPPPPPIPADEAALAALAELQSKRWLEEGRHKEYYSAVSDIVRTYLESGFAVAALERTTNELLRDLRRLPAFSGDVLTVLRELFEECDLVKFAKFRPETAEAQRTYEQALSVVQRTRGLLKKEDDGGAARVSS